MSEPSIIWTDDPRAQQAAVVGSKAANLSRFAAHNVPLGFCVLTRLKVSLNHGQHPSSGYLPPALQSDLAAAYEKLSARCEVKLLPVAVRSSAAEEDGSRFSFAGQHRTLLNVQGIGAVTEAVEACLSSASSPQALRYRALRGLSGDPIQIAVLVQRMIDADVSVVAFSANPVTGGRDEVVINSSWGLGESVVSGLVTPDAFVVNKHDMNSISRQVAVKESMTVRAAKGTEQVVVPVRLRHEPSLSDEQVLEVASLCTELEEAMGYPVDVECAYCKNILFLLQCRPITTLR